MEWTAHCGCVLAIRASDGEPTKLLRPCAIHFGAKPSDISGENRAMTIALMTVARHTDLPMGEVRVEFGPDRVARARGPDGKIVAAIGRLTLDEYLGAHAALTKDG